ncbi:MAG: Maf family protein [Gammaproteobacteria bacterium]
MNASNVYLASRSPRRAELLRQLGLRFEVLAADADESRRPGEAIEVYVERVVDAKLSAARERNVVPRGALLLAADTVVSIDAEMLGKPRDRDEALAMLARLSGREHRVLSCVGLQASGTTRKRLVVSSVRFRRIAAAEARAYWATGEPCDKAGGYAIQGIGAAFVEHLVGSYSGVMGLPLFETAELLRTAGIEIP